MGCEDLRESTVELEGQIREQCIEQKVLTLQGAAEVLGDELAVNVPLRVDQIDHDDLSHESCESLRKVGVSCPLRIPCARDLTYLVQPQLVPPSHGHQVSEPKVRAADSRSVQVYDALKCKRERPHIS